MTTIELKKVLIRKITEINDMTFLEAIKTILDSKTESEKLTLTTDQLNEIIRSKHEIENGIYISHEDLNKEISSWLGSK